MKKLLAILAVLALCLMAAPMAMADSDSWVGGSVGGGCAVYGTGDAYIDGYMYGDGGSNTSTGGTWTDMSANIWGGVSAYDGAGYVDGGTGGWTGAYEGGGYTYSYSSNYSSAYA
ncbi:hypothetical protein KJ934_00135, partial [Patescibacteria group bacterium]|nr:hypothetical protein [Patescibacteria group bacterium]